MEQVYKFVQRGLKKNFKYTGPIDGDIGRGSEAALNRVRGLKDSGWHRSRKAKAFAQILLNESGAGLGVDGLWGSKSDQAWLKYGPNKKKKKNPSTISNSGISGDGWMPGVVHDPRWNHSSCPALRAGGIVLHRSAGHYGTGDYNAGKWGNASHSSTGKKGTTLGFHFLIGKNEGEVIQFCSIHKKVSHVKRWASSYVGIEFSGDIGQWKDGLVNGEDLTKWQLDVGIEMINWICGELGIPKKRIKHNNKMFQLDEPFKGLLAHRDLSGNNHADSPNKSDWKKIMAGL